MYSSIDNTYIWCQKTYTHVTFTYTPCAREHMQECIQYVQTHMSPCTVRIHKAHIAVYCTYTLPVWYMLLCDTGRTRSTCMYDTTYCTMRMVWDLVMRNLKIESRDTMIALDPMYTQVNYIYVVWNLWMTCTYVGVYQICQYFM